MEHQLVVKTEFRFRAAAAGVLRRLIAKGSNNLTIQPIMRDGQFRYIIVRRQPK